MTMSEAYTLLTDVQKDYIAMVRELNEVKHMVKQVDPWSLPIVQRMEKGKEDLAIALGIKKYKPRGQ